MVLGIDGVPALQRLELACEYISQGKTESSFLEMVADIKSDLTSIIQDMAAHHGHKLDCKATGTGRWYARRAVAGLIFHQFCGGQNGVVKENKIKERLAEIKERWDVKAVCHTHIQSEKRKRRRRNVVADGSPTDDADSIGDTGSEPKTESISTDLIVSGSAATSKNASTRREPAPDKYLKNIAKERDQVVLGIGDVSALKVLESACRYISQPEFGIKEEVVNGIKDDLTALIQDMTAHHGHRWGCRGTHETRTEARRALARFISHDFCGRRYGVVVLDDILERLKAIKSKWDVKAECRAQNRSET